MRKKLELSKVLIDFISIHGSKYDYSKFIYNGVNKKSIIICKKHGEFKQHYNAHYKRKEGCKQCSLDIIRANMTNNFEYYKDKILEVHGKTYDYSKFIYVSKNKKSIIICKKHGEFKQSLNVHVDMKHGCPICRSSKGELKIREYLINSDIIFEQEKRFDGLGLKRFDFYLPKLNLCIEFDGEQHFKSFKFFGGDDGLMKTQLSDKIKNSYCENNHIKLLRISYKEFCNINKILERSINAF